MKTIAIKDIDFGSRVRKHFNETAIANLADSIHRLGLLQAPVLDGNKLVVGERRIRAVSLMETFDHELYYQGELIPSGYIPYTDFNAKDILEVMEAELEENIMREDLTIQEEAAARANIHKIRVLQNPEHTKQDTAKELSGPKKTYVSTDIRDALLIDEYKDLPEVQKASTKKEALKVIFREERSKHVSELAKVFKQENAFKSPHQLYCATCETVLPSLEDESIDVILTDPVYGIDAHDFNAQEGIKHVYDDTRENFESIIETIAREGYRICKARAHLYLFHDFRYFWFIKERLEYYGFKCWPRPLIWVKGNGLLARPNHGPRYTYECILFASKGDRETTKVAGDCITIRTLTKQRRGAEKPAALYHNLLSRSVLPGNSVLDACCGLGPIFPAANLLNCKAIGIDPDQEAIDFATLRLQNTLHLVDGELEEIVNE